MFEHEFLFDKLSYLTHLMRNFMQKHLNNLKKYFKFRVKRSLNVFVIIDSLKCLNSEKMHLIFFENFIDEQFEINDMMFHDVELIIDRQSILKDSNMQKIRNVFKSKLKHLFDVVVFSSKKFFSLIEKMQNDDYDENVF